MTIKISDNRDAIVKATILKATILYSFSVLLLLISSIFTSNLVIVNALAAGNVTVTAGSNNSYSSGRTMAPDVTGNVSQVEYITWYNKGTDLLNSGNYSDALTAFDKAIALDPTHAAAWHNKGQTLDKLGRFAEALASYDKARSLDPTIALTWNNRGTVLYELGRYNEALASYDKAISLDPTNAAYQQNKNITIKQLSSEPTNNLASNSASASVGPAGGNMTGTKNMTYSTPFVGRNVTAPAGGNIAGTATNVPTTQQNMAFQTYENKKGGFRIQYPTDWTAQRDSLGFYNFDPPGRKSSSDDLILRVVKFDQIPTSLADRIKHESLIFPTFKLIESRSITLNGNSADILVYTFMMEHGKGASLYKELDIDVTNGRGYYSLEFSSKFSAYDQYFSIAKTMFDSFQTLSSN